MTRLPSAFTVSVSCGGVTNPVRSFGTGLTSSSVLPLHFHRSLCFIGSIRSFYIIYDCITHIGCFPFCIDKSVFFRHGFRNCIWNGEIHVLIPAGKCVSESYRIFRLSISALYFPVIASTKDPPLLWNAI